ncbi:glycosyltransferase family 31 protein [Apodospora peruviana]|uniref:N-acetylgalactosaminide beta-1,3-galactosyltransferase n=1 Tax=Apodospora peruviana TaxID=516989 RepID=A0AAE0M6Y5_9PEZI|nr:glycosyltransferase family 31 protein [Apodospora peruviana]
MLSSSSGKDLYSCLSVRMLSLSRKSLAFLAVTSLSLVVLLITSHTLGSWPAFDQAEAYFHRGGPPNQHRPPPHAPGLGPGGQPHGSADDHLVIDTNFNASDSQNSGNHHGSQCDNFPDTHNILLVMKTGASEAYARLPAQLLTSLQCLPDFLIFSDMDQQVAGYQVHDSLATVLPEAELGNSDFDLYRRQKACLVDQEACNKLGDPASEGWNLDKYKNVHIAEEAYRMRPGYDWYVFVDADTYVSWPTLVPWLRTLKPTNKHYLGSVTLINNFGFGHGGSGYILSKRLMQDFVGKNPGIANKFDLRAKSECCGDYVFALALNEATKAEVKQVKNKTSKEPAGQILASSATGSFFRGRPTISGADRPTAVPVPFLTCRGWPTINGEKPTTLPFGPSHWCHPIVTMHHMNGEEINTLWDFERLRRSSGSASPTKPLLIKDIYQHYLAPKLQPVRMDWDNLADDRFYLDASDTAYVYEEWMIGRTKKAEDMSDLEKKAHMSFEDCRAACESLSAEECFSYQFQPGMCKTSKAFMLGKPVKKDVKGGRMLSGWDVDKIKAWIEKQGDCGRVKWPETGGGGKW